MDKAVGRYFQLKQKQREIEQELSELRQQILDHCAESGVTDTEIGRYRVRVIAQDRREYDDEKLYQALPDAEVWRLVSKADPSKIAGLVKLNVISEEKLRETYTMKKISSLQVERL
ncbi:hypothetical protein [Cohnella caldifontis]|uniref:hypothetical protein n=1 Tax=Cohnella caldifontis TaxID=3027471 RepID=UPI0023ED89C1|nr:hypothetical protein [Cohnella sp. YIM B05605]